MLPKSQIDKLKLRNKAIGVERRRNMSKLILEHAPNFPLGVSYKDIDKTFMEWVENDLYIAYDGKKLPTFKLFANQRINEYAQTWRHLDEIGNVLMNFKTVTRDNNPKKGTNQGEFYNIPGNRDYPMFIVPTLQENGTEAYDMYTMKQPFSIDMLYKIAIITNKYELLNEMNELVNYKFKSLNCYIAPNNHFMPMTLENISDESEYNIDDIKYYSQTYEIKIKAYIIREEDFNVVNLPSRLSTRVLGAEEKISPKIQIEEQDYMADECCIDKEGSPYYYKKMTLTIDFPTNTRKAEFEIDANIYVEQIETDNIYDFIMWINEEKQDFELFETNIIDGDIIKIKISRDDDLKESKIKIIGHDKNVILNKNYNPESSMDEYITEENINYKNEKLK